MKKLFLYLSLIFLTFNIKAQEKIYPEGLEMPSPNTYREMIGDISNNEDFKQYFSDALKLNLNRFNNIDSIYPGDTIYLPSLENKGIVKVTASNKKANEINDCIWKLSKKSYLNNLVEIRNKKTTDSIKLISEIKTKNVIKKTEKEINEKKYGALNQAQLYLIIYLIFAIIAFTIFYIFFENYLKRKLNKLILSKKLSINISLKSTEEKIIFFKSFLNNDEELISIEQGFLKRLFGRKKLRIKIQINYRKLFIYLTESESLTRIIIKNKSNNCYSKYYIDEGGIMIIKKNNIAFPPNWVFVPYFKDSKIKLYET